MGIPGDPQTLGNHHRPVRPATACYTLRVDQPPRHSPEQEALADDLGLDLSSGACSCSPEGRPLGVASCCASGCLFLAAPILGERSALGTE